MPARSTGLRLDSSIDEPLYRQIFDQIAERIRSGAFPPGYRLPPTRVLASELSTHRNTVVRAFEELAGAGFVESTVGRGTFVAAVEAGAAGRLTETSGVPWTSLSSSAVGAEPLGRLDRLARRPPIPGAVDLSTMQASPDLLPHELLRRCIDHVLRSRKADALGYAPREGLSKLREILASELARLGVPARAGDILITTGSQQALDLVARALIDPGDPFLVEESTYNGAINLFAAAGGRVRGVPSDSGGPDLEALELHARDGAKGFYLMPNCCNPTGICIGTERRLELVSWSRRSGIPLIEDDYGADLDLEDSPPPPSLRALDADVVHLGTFSKKLIPALRVGFMVCPEALQERILPLKHAMDLGTSVLLQYALCEFIERGYLRTHLQQVRAEYRRRRDALAEELRRGLPEKVEWSLPARGVLIWLTLPESIDAAEVVEEARREGVGVTPGVLYSSSGLDRSGLRLAYCHESVERVAEGGRRLSLVLRRLARRGTRGVGARMSVKGV